MIALTDRRAVVAVDLGAQSCRISLLRWQSAGPRIELVHRMENAPVSRSGHLYWDLSAICNFADEGLRACANVATEGIAAVGVTGWAVDYVRLNTPATVDAAISAARSAPVADPFCYRDSRNLRAMEVLHQRIPPEKIYALTGIQVLPFNTVYQLHADKIADVPNDQHWLNLPEYMLYRWGARPVAEYTNATHTGMVELGTMRWSREIFSAAGLDQAVAPEIVPPGSIVGRLQGPLTSLASLRDVRLIAPACHDTASAIAGIPMRGKDWAYISSGTWSLVGTTLDQPCAGSEAGQLNFTNEGAVGGKVCFHRNVNGLWLLNQCMEAWQSAGERRPLEDLIAAAAELLPPVALLNIDNPDLLIPGNMPEKIEAQLRREAGSRVASSPEAMVSLVLHSLAAQYATVLRQAEKLTGRHFDRIYVVGGGSKNQLLNRLTEQVTGLKVSPGASESSTLGNFAVQLAVLENLNRNGKDRSRAGVEHEAVAFWAGVLGNSFAETHPLLQETSSVQPGTENSI